MLTTLPRGVPLNPLTVQLYPEEKLTLPKFGIALKSLSAYDLATQDSGDPLQRPKVRMKYFIPVIVRYILSVEMLLGHGKKQEQWEMLVGG